MNIARLAPLGIAILLALTASGAHRRLRPDVSAVVLTAIMGVTLVAAVPAVALAAAAFVAHPPAIGGGLAWCHEVFGVHASVDPWLGATATGWSLIAGHRVWLACRSWHGLRRVEPGAMEVVDDDLPYALTLPGAGRRVMVSTGLIATLDPQQFAVVVAHERAHADHRHDLHLLLADIAVGVVPFLRPVRRRLRFELERWADENAVRDARGDRRHVAETLVHVALEHRTPGRFPLEFNGLGVTARVDALLRPPDLTHPALWRAVLFSATASVAVAAVVQLHHSFGVLDRICPG